MVKTDRQTDRDIEIVKLNAFHNAIESLLVCGTCIKSIHYHLILLDIIIGRKTEALLCDDFTVILRLSVDII